MCNSYIITWYDPLNYRQPIDIVGKHIRMIFRVRNNDVPTTDLVKETLYKTVLFFPQSSRQFVPDSASVVPELVIGCDFTHANAGEKQNQGH